MSGTVSDWPFSASASQRGPSSITHLDTAGDHKTCWTVLWHSEFIQALRKRGPVVINVSKVDGHIGNRVILAD